MRLRTTGPYGPINEWEVREFVKCANDVDYFLNTYGYISDPIKGTIPFKLYPYQRRVLRDFVQHRFNISLKPRQMGLSWLAMGYALHLILFDKGKDVRCISKGEREAVELLDKAKFIYNNLPLFLQVDSKEKAENETKLAFTGQNSKIISVPTSKNAGHSISASLFIMDEAARIPWADEVWKGVFPTLSQGGKAILISTANGIGNLFHKLWKEAIAGENDFNPIKIDWREHPDRDDEWYQLQFRNLGPRGVAEQVDCNFLQSGSPVFAEEFLEPIRVNKKEPVETGDGLKIWTHPKADIQYLHGIDVAAGGRESDFSAHVVLDSKTFEQVAQLHGRWPLDVYARKCDELIKRYPGRVGVERNTVGMAVLMKFKEWGTNGLYYHTDPESDWFNIEKPGWPTNAKTKPIMINELEEAIRYGYLPFLSEELLNELHVFSYSDKGYASAPNGYNDDLVMALAIAWQMRKSVCHMSFDSIAI